jgi:hypothetical protein
VIADFLKFRKQSPMVRTMVYAGEFKQYLTVPVQHPGRDPQPPLYKIKLDTEENWQQKHLRTLESRFSGYPFFADYFPFIAEIYENKYSLLANFSIDLLLWLLHYLMPEKKLVIASENSIFNLELLKKWLNNVNEYCFLIDPAEKSFYRKHFPKIDHLSVRLQPALEFPETYQLNISILALLFLKGPETPLYFTP